MHVLTVWRNPAGSHGLKGDAETKPVAQVYGTEEQQPVHNWTIKS